MRATRALMLVLGGVALAGPQDLAEARKLFRSDSRVDRARAVTLLAQLDSRDAILVLRDGTRRTATELDRLGDKLDKLDDRYVKALEKLWY